MSSASAAPTCGILQDLQYAFAAHIRDPENSPRPADIEPRRMTVYTELFFNNIESLLAANFPVIRTLHDESAWRGLVRDFYRMHRSHTPLFTEIAREFIRHLEDRSESGAGDPPFLIELAHYEWSELALSLDEHDIGKIAHDPQGDVLTGVPLVSPLARVLAYRFPVHRIGPDFRPHEPAPQPVLLLLSRGRDDVVRFLEIDALTALLIERLQVNRNHAGLVCLDALLHELGRGDDPALRASGAAILARLRARDAIIGTIATR
ncbi:DNA-binding domain-containing protein [Dokdonella soli]|uniref:DUF2063 domain-containing protein n=1 Tax=Dokdonella soli TaxID=529810 RepID=A0ABP3THS3_9GAMM